MSDKSIWATLSAIDCNKHVEKKGGFSYLAWTWAWAMVKEKYPMAYYHLEPDITYPDGTMEVRVRVGIPVEGAPGDALNTMWLPVLDFKNKAIPNPNAFDINSARMRCLVKCLAMFGLGHYIYAGESVPQAPAITDEQLETFMQLVADKNAIGLVVYMAEIGDDAATAAFNAAPSGQKVKLKDSVRALQKAALETVGAYVEQICEAIEASDEMGFRQLIEELDKPTKKMVWARLTDIQKIQTKKLMEKAA